LKFEDNINKEKIYRSTNQSNRQEEANLQVVTIKRTAGKTQQLESGSQVNTSNKIFNQTRYLDRNMTLILWILMLIIKNTVTSLVIIKIDG
jgi:hypothetical protein